MECLAGLFQAIGSGAALHTRAHRRLGCRQQQRDVGRETVAGEAVGRLDEGAIEPAAGSLVGHRGVVEPVTQHDVAPAERGLDHLVDNLGAGRLVDEQLGPVAHGAVGRIEHHAPQRLAHCRAARLAQAQHRAPMLFQKPREEADLGGLAHPVAPLEGDEDAARRCGLHGDLLGAGRRADAAAFGFFPLRHGA